MKRSLVWSLAALVALVMFSPSLQAGQNAAKDKTASKAAAGSQEEKGANVDAGTYVIGPQDVLEISVWKEQNISGTVPVRPDGKISLPLVNDVQAAGLTPMQLQEVLTKEFKKFIDSPQVTVIVKQVNSRRIYVLGEVARPGVMEMFPHMTVLQALAQAGGFSQFAKLSKIYVMRTVDGQQKTFPFNYKKVVRGEQANENIVLKPGDTIVVP